MNIRKILLGILFFCSNNLMAVLDYRIYSPRFMYSTYMESAAYLSVYSARYGYLEDLKYFLNEEGVDVNVALGLSTALHQSALKGHLDIVRYLVEQGANIHATDHHGDTPLNCAARNGHLAIVKYLHRQGASIHVKGEYENTALISSVKSGHSHVAEYLVEQGIDIEAKCSHRGANALIWSAYYGCVPCVKVLVQAGANLYATDKYGKTALKVSEYYSSSDFYQCKKVADYLRQQM